MRLAAAEALEQRCLLNAVVAPADPTVAGVANPLPPMPGHTFYVQGIQKKWDQASAITPNTANDLLLNTLPIDSDYLACCEAGGTDNIGALTNGSTQSIVLGKPSGNVSDASDPSNDISDLLTPWHATYVLGGSQPDPNGYDITEIDSITGHQDFRTQQNIDILVEPVGSNQFVSLSGGAGFSFTQDGSGRALDKGAAQMAIVNDRGGEIIGGIKAVEFLDMPGDQAFFRELVVTGTPGAAPASAPAPPVGLTASVSPGEVSLAWTGNTGNASAYVIERSADGVNFSPIAIVGPASANTGQSSYVDHTGATAATYAYRIRAFNSFGGGASSSPGNAVTVSTTSVVVPPADHAPVAPMFLGATSSGTTARLAWTAEADNETGFAILRANSSSGPFAQVAIAPPVPYPGNTVGYQDTGLQPDQTYYYEVESLNTFQGGARSAPAGPVGILTGPGAGAEAHYFNQPFASGAPSSAGFVTTPDYFSPAGLPDWSIRTFSNSEVFTGKLRSDAAGVYTFVSNTADDGYLFVDGVLVSSDPGDHPQRNAVTLAPLMLAANTPYDFVFLQSNNQVQSAAHLQWITPAMATAGMTTPVLIPDDHLSSLSDTPSAPGSLELDPSVPNNPSSHSVDLTFVADNNSVVGFQLLRSSDGGGTWSVVNRIGPGSNTPTGPGVTMPAHVKMEDAGAAPGSSYLYRVQAFNFDGASPPSNIVRVNILTLPPTATSANPPGVELHLYNGAWAAQADGTDPRNVAVAHQPQEFTAVDGSIDISVPDATAYPVLSRINDYGNTSVWTGKIVTDQAGVYSFSVNSTDDSYMWVNDTLVSITYGVSLPQTAARLMPLTLAAHAAYNFVLIQSEVIGSSMVQALWTEPGQNSPTLIPAYRPAVGASPAAGGFVQLADLPHQQSLDAAGDVLNDPTSSAAGKLTVTSGPSGATLKWADQSFSELWFEMQRTTAGADGNPDPAGWSDVGTTGMDEGSFTDSTAVPGTTYFYRVRGVNFEGAGPWSNVESNIPPPLALIGQACDRGMARLLITARSPGAGEIEIQQSVDAADWADAGGSPIAGNSTVFVATNLDPTRTYFFRARYMGGAGTGPSAFSDVVAVSAAGPQPINDGTGFIDPIGLRLNGSANFTSPNWAPPNALQLTPNTTFQAGSAFTTDVQNIADFETTFDYTLPRTNVASDGIAFVIQNSPAGPAALGPTGGGLGYGPDQPGAAGQVGIPTSVAIKFDLVSNFGEGPDSTGLFINGDSPSVPTGANPVEAVVDMRPSGVDLHAPGHVFRIRLAYDGTTLHETVTDLMTGAAFTHDYPVNIPAIVGGHCAYVGFTGGTGAGTAEQDILNWTFYGSPDTIRGGGASDSITLIRDPDQTDIDWTIGGGPLEKMPVNDPKGLTINSNTGQDTVTLDYSNGIPVPNLLKLNGDFIVNGFNGVLFSQTIDIGQSTVRLNYTGASPLPIIQGYLRRGFDGGKWDGTGIISSAAAANPGMGVADVDDGSAITLSYRRIGDADGNGSVDFADFVVLARNFGRQNADWSQGDFNYDGEVDFNDLLLLAHHYGPGVISADVADTTLIPTAHRHTPRIARRPALA